MWHRHKTALGIHIGEEGLSLAALHYHKKEVELVAYHDWIVSDKSNEGKFPKNLSDWLKENRIRTKDVFASLPASQSMKKTCGFHKTLREEDIQIELSLNQQKYFGGIQEMLLFDMVKLEPAKTDAEMQQYDVFAARLSEMTWRRSLLIDAGLQPAAIELDQYALLRLLHFVKAVSLVKNEAAVLLDLTRGTRLIFFDPQEVLLDTLQEDGHYQAILQNFSIQFPQYTLKNLYVFASDEQKRFLSRCSQQDSPVPVTVVNIAEKISVQSPRHKAPLPFEAIGLALRGYYD